MERTETELTLEEMIPSLEQEHDAEPDLQTREAIWTLIDAVEVYLLAKNDKQRRQ